MTSIPYDETAAAPAPGWRPRARALAQLARTRAVNHYRSLATARPHRFVPAIAGAGLISACFGMRFGAWLGLGVAGLFCLRFDARL